jgi:hypothetical protein
MLSYLDDRRHLPGASVASIRRVVKLHGALASTRISMTIVSRNQQTRLPLRGLPSICPGGWTYDAAVVIWRRVRGTVAIAPSSWQAAEAQSM